MSSLTYLLVDAGLAANETEALSLAPTAIVNGQAVADLGMTDPKFIPDDDGNITIELPVVSISMQQAVTTGIWTEL